MRGGEKQLRKAIWDRFEKKKNLWKFHYPYPLGRAHKAQLTPGRWDLAGKIPLSSLMRVAGTSAGLTPEA